MGYTRLSGRHDAGILGTGRWPRDPWQTGFLDP